MSTSSPSSFSGRAPAQTSATEYGITFLFGAAFVELLAISCFGSALHWRLLLLADAWLRSIYRSSRPSIPSPLSSPSYTASSLTSPSPSWPSTATSQRRPPPIDTRSQGNTTPSSAGHTTFFSDSSNPSSPESPRPPPLVAPNDTRSVHQQVKRKPVVGSSNKAPSSAMASPTTSAAPSGSATGLPRNSSIDSAISAISSTAHANSPTNNQAKSEEIAKLIKTAGSPEAVIQYLLKEKQSQAQQNSQLWRLVDKQRAMILGLNKDLEAALKDKDKYRKKLKELMASPLVVKSAAGQDDEQHSETHSNALLLRQEVDSPRESAAPFPRSLRLGSEGQLDSPVDMKLAPYPITPPADRAHAPPSAVAELLNPSEEMPKPQEYALDHYNHEAEEEAADKARKEKSNGQLKEIPFIASLPPSRSLPNHPPMKPPPKPPTANAPPTVTVMEPTPQPDEGIGKFPSPPRKAPPAPLQLRQEIRRQLDSPTIDEDTDSEYDDILEVDEIIPEKRGRRRTREEDDREREVIAIQEAEARSVSKMGNPGVAEAPSSGTPSSPSTLSPNSQPAASMDAVLSSNRPRELTAPILSPGLPASPRPFGNPKMSLAKPPMSPRGGGPLSPRPPRQLIPMPPGTPLIVPPTASLSDGNPLKKAMDAGDYSKGLSSPVERTAIFRGLVTEEYPDLLLPPNALPSVAVRVASSRMKPSRASLLSLTQLEEDPVFTLAILSRADGGELWRVEKDSASLAKLDQRLKQCGAFTARTPDRSLFTGHAPAKIDARRVVLDQYMDELLNTPLDNATALELCKYLSTHTLPPNADETGQTFKPKDDNSSIRSDGRPTRNGYLTKKGKNFGGWKSRFFVLNGPYLKYYETPGGAHLGTIKLQNAQIGKQSQNNEANAPANQNNDEELDSQYRHAFLVLEPKKKDSSNHVKHVLCAESDRERDIWVENLLQWIDYRDPEEDQPPARPTVHDRQTSGDQLNSANKSKKGSKAHQTSGSDTLIGVRYDSTHAGDAPHQGAPGGRPKTSGSQSDHHASMDSHSKLISGPKDPQVISDASMWGNRIGLSAPPPAPAPSHDEKKQRKRSFFGFGPKARTSSDGQESLFGGSENGSGATPPQNGYHGPVRHVFGAPLAEAVRYNSPVDVDVPLPSVVYRCIQYLESQNAIFEEGIFRLSGSNVVIKGLRERFNNEGDINLVTDEQYYDIHAVASLLKLYLRELPTSILTRDLHLEFMSITTEITDKSEKMAALNELSQRLPQANATLLKYLIAFLIRIINNSDINKMTVRNVGIVFSPTLNIPAPVFATFLQNYEAIFGVDPEEYELPSPVSESESNSRSDSTARFDPPPGRPSTSSGSASPRHHGWPESIRDPARSTPTPPLLMNLNAARGSPTPSGTSRHSYEPSYLLHQSPRAVSQPLHDTGSGSDGHVSQPPHRASPAYERSLLPVTVEDQNGNLAAYDQGSVARRRESAIMMGGSSGLQHQQGSKSRLREEAHY
ncbi:rho gap domain-containing [Trichoderma arundinaceum]|uniref:Rho gap domain-containing n=1 Tax=Trichoderma arundinaceum TaxID=490622 RepID=A0A395N7C1_TRIAR|nr:rho gap domain-containing [Trichoderma arundinaceum]